MDTHDLICSDQTSKLNWGVVGSIWHGVSPNRVTTMAPSSLSESECILHSGLVSTVVVELYLVHVG